MVVSANGGWEEGGSDVGELLEEGDEDSVVGAETDVVGDDAVEAPKKLAHVHPAAEMPTFQLWVKGGKCQP